MYIGMEMMDTDLNSILLQQRLVPGYIKLFLYQLLRGVKVSYMTAPVAHVEGEWCAMPPPFLTCLLAKKKEPMLLSD